MRPISRFLERSWAYLIMVLMSCYILYPTSPYNMPFAARDSGVFLYMGWRILNGQIPYRDIWDHKPPLIFYIDALGLLIANDSRWGVWFIEITAITLASFFSLIVIRSIFSNVTAVIATLLWMISFPYMNYGGNLPTEYALPLQFLSIYLAYRILRGDNTFTFWFILGITGALLFFLKQTAIGIFVSILLYIYISQFQKREYLQIAKTTAWLLSGFLLVSIPIVIFFLANNALADFYSAVFTYNFVYVSEPPYSNRMGSVYRGLWQLLTLTSVGLWQATLIGFVAFASRAKESKPKITRSILLIVLIDLFIEFVLISISGRLYEHYFITIIPPMIIFSSLGLEFIRNIIHTSRNMSLLLRSIIFIAAILLIYVHYNNYRDYTNTTSDVGNSNIISYIQSNTDQNDAVLLWGAESYINFFAKRESPTKFVYQYPLYSNGYTNDRMIVMFLDNIIVNKPLLIIDTANEETPFLYFPINNSQISMRLDYLRAHYIYTTKIDNFTVYTRSTSK